MLHALYYIRNKCRYDELEGKALQSVQVTKDGVRIGNWIY
jgi:hypothetical protein